MRSFRAALAAALVVLAGCAPAPVAPPGREYSKSFLSDYSQLTPRTAVRGGIDYIYLAPGVLDRLAGYRGVMIDEPEVHLSPLSSVQGAKPDDLKAIAGLLRQSVRQNMIDGGYNVVDAPAPGVILMRFALTDLMLEKTERSLFSYTPIGAVINLGEEAMKDFMAKYDITKMAIQAELKDSQSNDVLAQFVALRGGGLTVERLQFSEINANMKIFASSLRCQIDNARVPEARRINCQDTNARLAREAAMKTAK